MFMKKVMVLFKERPLAGILLAAVLARLLAVIFSKGFAFFDDHFLIIAAVQRWMETGTPGDMAGGGRIIYLGFHYLLFILLDKLSMTDPQVKMYFVRFFHAAYSLLVVIFGYMLAKRLACLK